MAVKTRSPEAEVRRCRRLALSALITYVGTYLLMGEGLVDDYLAIAFPKVESQQEHHAGGRAVALRKPKRTQRVLLEEEQSVGAALKEEGAGAEEAGDGGAPESGSEESHKEGEGGGEAIEGEGGEEEGGEEEGGEEGGSEEPEEEMSAEEKAEEEEEEDLKKPAGLTRRDVIWNLAMSVVMFFAVDIGLLYVMKWRDEDIRSYAYRMVSSTLSIFMAVMIHAAVFRFFTDQIVPSPPPRGLGLKLSDDGERTMKLIVGLFIYLGFLFLMNVLGSVFRDRLEALYTCNTIFGHLTAFAGIAFYGSWQDLSDSGGYLKHHHYAFFSVAGVCSFVLLMITTKFRSHLDKRQRADYSQVQQGEENEESEWIEEVEEAEDDATALIFGFLASQLILWWRTGDVPTDPEFDKTRTQEDVVWMLWPVLLSIFALGILTHIKKECPDFEKLGRTYDNTMAPALSRSQLTSGRVAGEVIEDGKKLTRRMARRVVDALQTFCAMTMSWCALRMGQWQLQIKLSSSNMNFTALVGILNAIVLTCVSCIMIFFLDAVADRLQHGCLCCRYTEEDMTSPGQSPSRNEAPPTASDQGHTLVTRASLASLPASLSLDPDKANRIMWADHIERWVEAVRKIIDALGLLVGLCWERAADAAIEEIVKDSTLLHNRPVIAQLLAALVVTVMICPAWIRYVVPVAKKSREEHSLALALERISSTHMSKRRPKHEQMQIESLQRTLVEACERLDTADDAIVVTVPVLMSKIEDFQEQVTAHINAFTNSMTQGSGRKSR